MLSRSVRRVFRFLTGVAGLLVPVAAFGVADVTPPQLAGMQLDPLVVDATYGPVSVTMDLYITDNVTGLDRKSVV